MSKGRRYREQRKWSVTSCEKGPYLYEKELENLDEALSALARHRRPLFRISFSKKRRALLKQSKLAREALALIKVKSSDLSDLEKEMWEKLLSFFCFA